MDFWGYSNRNKLLKLKEVSIETTLEELNDVILLLNHVKEEHMRRVLNVENEFPIGTPVCSLHLKDWSLKYNKGNGDLIIITQE